MASYLDKTKVPTAVTDNTKLDLGHQHIGTTDFFHLEVATIHELVPGSKIDVKQETFCRLNPMPVPTFSRASLHNRAFFVPFRTIFRGADDYLSDSPHIGSDGGFEIGSLQLSSVPTTTNGYLIATFTAFAGNVGDDLDTPDIMCVPLDDDDPEYAPDFAIGGTSYAFSVLGRRAIAQLEQLGYKVNWDAKDNTVYSALPLLALGRIYCDYFFPAQYLDTWSYNKIMALCNYDATGYPGQLTSSDIYYLLRATAYTMYDSDYFVSAWDLPNSPSHYCHSDFKIVNVDSVETLMGSLSIPTNTYSYKENGYVTNNTGSATQDNRLGGASAPFITPLINAVNPNAANVNIDTPISEYLLHSLSALSAFLKRNQLAGARSWERMLARYGKAVDASKMNRSLYLGSFSQDIQIGDVMSTSDTVNSEGTAGSQLGGYAGKGISYGNGHFDFSSDEFGYFIILTSVVPHVLYTQGIDPQVKRITHTQFYMPEFDGLGAQPIVCDELFIPQEGATVMTGDPHEQIFGWCPRYADYKQSTTCDRITGNFRLPSLNGDAQDSNNSFNAANSWHMQRTFNGTGIEGNWANLVHGLPFVEAANDVAQYKRLFYYTEPDAPDNFTYIHNFEVAEWFPGKPLYDTWDFDKEGRDVTLDVNGVKLN